MFVFTFTKCLLFFVVNAFININFLLTFISSMPPSHQVIAVQRLSNVVLMALTSTPLPVLPSTKHVAVFFFCLLHVLEVFGLNATLICSLIIIIIIINFNRQVIQTRWTQSRRNRRSVTWRKLRWTCDPVQHRSWVAWLRSVSPQHHRDRPFHLHRRLPEWPLSEELQTKKSPQWTAKC